MRKFDFVPLLAVLCATTSLNAAAPFTATAIGKVTLVENGWSGEGMAFSMTAPTSGCPAPPTDYAIEKSHPAYKELVNMLLAAYATSANLSLVVDQGVCSIGNRTRVISIRLQ